VLLLLGTAAFAQPEPGPPTIQPAPGLTTRFEQFLMLDPGSHTGRIGQLAFHAGGRELIIVVSSAS